jgi:hypothetical protein
MKMMDEGKRLKDIRAYIDKTYSQYGPSTPTPPRTGQSERILAQKVSNCEKPYSRSSDRVRIGRYSYYGRTGQRTTSRYDPRNDVGTMQEPKSGEQSQDIMRVHAFCRGALLDKWRSNQKGV